MAQWIARWTSDPEVVGSSPTLIEFIFSNVAYTTANDDHVIGVQ